LHSWLPLLSDGGLLLGSLAPGRCESMARPLGWAVCLWREIWVASKGPLLSGGVPCALAMLEHASCLRRREEPFF
jgi:hypothetical protein